MGHTIDISRLCMYVQEESTGIALARQLVELLHTKLSNLEPLFDSGTSPPNKASESTAAFDTGLPLALLLRVRDGVQSRRGPINKALARKRCARLYSAARQKVSRSMCQATE